MDFLICYLDLLATAVLFGFAGLGFFSLKDNEELFEGSGRI